MSYDNQKFYSRHSFVASPVTSWGTATASGTNGYDLTAAVVGLVLPAFFRRCKLSGVKMRCTTIPNAASTAVVAHVMNGTDTAGTVTLTTATAGQILTGSLTAANGTFTAGAQATIKTTGTSTASAAALGSWEVWFEVQELPLVNSTN